MNPPARLIDLLQRLLDAGDIIRRQNTCLGRVRRVRHRSHVLGLAHLDKCTAQLAAREHVHRIIALHGTRQRRVGSRVGRLPAQHGGIERGNTGNVVAGHFQPADLADGRERPGFLERVVELSALGVRRGVRFKSNLRCSRQRP